MRKLLWVITLGAVLSGPAEAGRIEDGFRAFIDRLRSVGQQVDEFRHSLSFQEVRVPELASRVETLPLGRQSYAVFVTPGCRACTEAVRFLQSKGLDHEVMDVTKSVTAREAYTLTRGNGFPLLLVGTQRLTGWSERLFKDAVRNDVQNTLINLQGQGS